MEWSKSTVVNKSNLIKFASFVVIFILNVVILFSHEKVNANDFKSKIEKTKNSIILDVRTKDEYKKGHLVKSQNIDIYDAKFEDKVKKLDKTKTIFVYCHAGGRSSDACEIMTKLGFKSIIELEEGYSEWLKLSLPIEK